MRKIGYYGTAKRSKNVSEHQLVGNKSSPDCDYRDESYESNKEWLGCMDTPSATVEIKFTETFKGRQYELTQENRNNVNFYKEWLIYLHPDGHRLVSKDISEKNQYTTILIIIF